MHYTIKQMAQLFSVSEHTLRYYTDIGMLPCDRGCGNRRIFTDESINWMQGIECLRGCGFSMEDIKRYCELCLKEESGENLQARYQMILNARRDAYKRLDEARAVVDYMDSKVAHYESILSGLTPDDSNPKNWTAEKRPPAHK